MGILEQKLLALWGTFLWSLVAARVATQTESWNQFGYDSELTRYNPNYLGLSKSNANLTLDWAYHYGCSTYTPPLVRDDVVVSGSWCGEVVALNATSGNVIWKDNV